MQVKKNIKTFIIVLVSIFIVIGTILFYMWFHYYNKCNLLRKFVVDNSKEVYILGTLGTDHFNKIYNYSLEDVLSVIQHVKPDLVLLDAREESYRNYGIIDGKIDMCVAYSYCFQHNIPMKLVNWWIVDNINPKEMRTNLRDDNVFIKVSRQIKEIKPDAKILVICGNNHYYEQVSRYLVAGFVEEKLKEKRSYFSYEGDFLYPPMAAKAWKDRTFFYAYVFPSNVKIKDYLFPEVKERYIIKNPNKFYRDEIKYCKTLINNSKKVE